MTTNKNLEVIPFTASQQPIMEFDFDSIKGGLISELDKYENVVVTAETLAADKKLAQELSAKGKQYNDLRIAKVKEISAPIKVFEDQMKELVGLCKEASEQIKCQVKVFEDERLVKLKVLLGQTITDMRGKSDIKEEFFNSDITTLIKLGSLTKGGALTKGATTALSNMVTSELMTQQKVENRLLQLESESYKAGLKTPLVRLNVESFLLADDEAYAAGVAKIIESELQREEAANLRNQEQEERKAKADAILAKRQAEKEVQQENHQEPQVEQTQHCNTEPDQDFQNATPNDYGEYAQQMMAEQESHQQEPAIEVKQGNVVYVATAKFKLSVPSHVPVSMIESKLKRMLLDAGITSLDTIEVESHA